MWRMALMGRVVSRGEVDEEGWRWEVDFRLHQTGSKGVGMLGSSHICALLGVSAKASNCRHQLPGYILSPLMSRE